MAVFDDSGGAAQEAPEDEELTPGQKKNVPWVELYRPQTLDDVVGNDETILRLRAIAKTGNLPNVILSGPPGTGKTTSMLCLARQMLGPAVGDAVLELNASDDRGIDVVRDRIKSFAKKKVRLPPGSHKLVILDEADSMTTAAQQAMRRTMELYSSTTRFALACNTSSKIAEPIQSRCAILRFSRLTDAQILQRLEKICTKEHVTATDGGLQALVFTADGDMRNAINNLQSTHSGFGTVDESSVFKVCDQPHPLVIKDILLICLHVSTQAANDDDNTKNKGARSEPIVIDDDDDDLGDDDGGKKKTTKTLADALAKLRGLATAGYAPIDLCSTMFKVAKNIDVPEPMKLNALKEIGFAHMRISDGAASFLQLAGLLAKLSTIPPSE